MKTLTRGVAEAREHGDLHGEAHCVAALARTHTQQGRGELALALLDRYAVAQNAFGKSTAEATLFEWQTDSLAAADTTNGQIEGDDISSFEAVTATTRVKNYVQISRKTVIISGTQEVVNKAGRKSEDAPIHMG